MNDYVLTRQARTDLRGIWRYSADQWSSEQADRYIRKVHEAIITIAAAPNKGRRCDDVRPGYRKYRAGAHVIFYRPVDGGIEVMRVLHRNMDFQRHLRGSG